jgi:hypothetical protein
MLIASLSIHFFGMLSVQAAYARRVSQRRYLSFAQQAGLALLVLMMLLTHIVEIVAWAALLYFLGAIAVFRDASYYVSVTYTTLGYGEGTLPLNWRFLAPMIAMSGLFAFGWTTGVMFRIVTQDTPAAAPKPASGSKA